MENLYKKIIMDHYKYPSNKGLLKSSDFEYKGANPFCGDELSINVSIDENGIINRVGWEAKGCVISQASASMFSELIKGKNIDTIKNIDVNKFLQDIGGPFSPMRTKCALLPLYAVKNEYDKS